MKTTLNEKLLKANGKVIRHNGMFYRIYSCRLGSRVLADAEPMLGDRINLITTRSKVGMELRRLVDMNLVS